MRPLFAYPDLPPRTLLHLPWALVDRAWAPGARCRLLSSQVLAQFFLHQIFDLVDGLYQQVRTFFSSRRAFWDEVRSAFRLFLFTSWDQVLVRMNSPPEPLPRYESR